MNLSRSIARGVYIAKVNEGYETGDLVVIDIPKQVRGFDRDWFRYKESLLKRIVGIEGDWVCYFDSEVKVNSKLYMLLKEDHQGLPLPRQPQGCFEISKDEFFVAGDSVDSFDSRYFGVVEDSEIRTVVRPLW